MEDLYLNLSDSKFDQQSHWSTPIECKSEYPIWFSRDALSLFDQNGYHLTNLEQHYAETNGYPKTTRRHETVLRQDWITGNWVFSGPHINHSDLFERKGYSGEAAEQLKSYAKKNTLLWKLIKMKPKWGIDISIDYTDSIGNVFEVFHYEWDSFVYDEVVEKKQEIEQFVLKQDWKHAADTLLRKRDEWQHLEFFDQTKWRTSFYGLEPERFKQVIWSD